MNFLIIGLGSMGKRRIRCLKHLNYLNITGYDTNKQRVDFVIKEYGINAYHNIDDIFNAHYDIMIISVPPNIHHIFMHLALKHNINCFIEAGIIDADYNEIMIKSKVLNLCFMPSATLCFHPAIKKIKEIINDKILGKLSNIIYHSGQYLPDWHKYENVADYYVSNKETGGCREIVPFELTWLTKIFGFPDDICCFFGKTININGAETIDDTYDILFKYNKCNDGQFFIVFVVDVVTKLATRRLIINGDISQLIWDWNYNNITIYNNGNKIIHSYEVESFDGYNKNITEQMYIDELEHFINNINSKKLVNTLDYDHSVLKLLYSIENNQNFVKTGILINVRLNSKRLPKKQLICIGDKSFLQILIERLYDCFNYEITNNCAKIVIASADYETNKELENIKYKYDYVDIFYGNEHNIPFRHLQCAKHFGFTDIVVIDGDDIFVSKTACKDIYYSDAKCIKSVGFPLGMNAIGMNVNYLSSIICNRSDEIHETGWTDIFEPIQKNIYDYDLNNYLRFTLDYEDDVKFFQTVIENLNDENIITIDDYKLIEFIIDNKYYEINCHINDLYWKNFNYEKLIQYPSNID